MIVFRRSLRKMDQALYKTSHNLTRVKRQRYRFQAPDLFFYQNQGQTKYQENRGTENLWTSELNPYNIFINYTQLKKNWKR